MGGESWGGILKARVLGQSSDEVTGREWRAVHVTGDTLQTGDKEGRRLAAIVC